MDFWSLYLEAGRFLATRRCGILVCEHRVDQDVMLGRNRRVDSSVWKPLGSSAAWIEGS